MLSLATKTSKYALEASRKMQFVLCVLLAVVQCSRWSTRATYQETHYQSSCMWYCWIGSVDFNAKAVRWWNSKRNWRGPFIEAIQSKENPLPSAIYHQNNHSTSFLTGTIFYSLRLSSSYMNTRLWSTDLRKTQHVVATLNFRRLVIDVEFRVVLVASNRACCS